MKCHHLNLTQMLLLEKLELENFQQQWIDKKSHNLDKLGTKDEVCPKRKTGKTTVGEVTKILGNKSLKASIQRKVT